MNDQDEMFEMATELPAFLGCPQHMPTHLPGGFDGVEPVEDEKAEAYRRKHFSFGDGLFPIQRLNGVECVI